MRSSAAPVRTVVAPPRSIATDDARYVAIQLHDAWGRTLDPCLMTNRNNAISSPNPDGTITYVVANKEPGVANWLDTQGHESGSVIMRWQGITTSKDASPALVLDSRMASLHELRQVLPRTVPMASAEVRREEIMRRAMAHERRLR